MVKHGKRRKGRLFVPRIDSEVAFSGLATDDLVAVALTSVLDQECWANSMDVVCSLSDMTAGDGPVLVGVAHSDYSAAEIEEWLEETSSWIKSNKIGMERARRKCRIIGSFESQTEALGAMIMNDGKPVRVKLGFMLESGMTLQFWVYNLSSTSLATGLFHAMGKAYLRPV